MFWLLQSPNSTVVVSGKGVTLRGSQHSGEAVREGAASRNDLILEQPTFMETNSCRSALTLSWSNIPQLLSQLAYVLEAYCLSLSTTAQRVHFTAGCVPTTAAVLPWFSTVIFKWEYVKTAFYVIVIFFSGAFYLWSSKLRWCIFFCLENPFSYLPYFFFLVCISQRIQETNLLILFVVHFSMAFLLLSLEFWLKTNRFNNLKLSYPFFWGLKIWLCG